MPVPEEEDAFPQEPSEEVDPASSEEEKVPDESEPEQSEEQTVIDPKDICEAERDR